MRAFWALGIFAALAAIGALFFGGCNEVTITKANVSLRGPYTYEKQTGMYVITRVYKLPSDPEAAMVTGNGEEASDKIPATFEITHIDGETVVTMVEVSRSCTGASTAAGGHLTDVTVTYEGHVLGVLHGEPDSTGGTEQILFDILTHESIGPNLEGTNRIVPGQAFTIIENVSAAAVEGQGSYLEVIGDVTGTTNEAGWVDPVMGKTWDAGVWVYHGAPGVRNRDGTYTFTHKLSLKTSGQTFNWRGYHEETQQIEHGGAVMEQPVRIYDDDETQSTIYTPGQAMPGQPGFWMLFGGQ